MLPSFEKDDRKGHTNAARYSPMFYRLFFYTDRHGELIEMLQEVDIDTTDNKIIL